MRVLRSPLRPVVALACGVTLLAPARAASQDPGWRIGPTVGVVWLDEDGDAATLSGDRVESGAEFGWGVEVERGLDARWSVGAGVALVDAELQIVRDDPLLRPPDDRRPVDLDVVAIDARVVRRWTLAERLVLRGRAGVGAMRTGTERGVFAPPCLDQGPQSCDVVASVHDESETFLVLRFGAGLEVPFANRWSARLSASDRMHACSFSTMEDGRDRSQVGRLVCGSDGQGPLLHHLDVTFGLEIGL